MTEELTVSTAEVKEARSKKKFYIRRKRLSQFVVYGYLPLMLLLTLSCVLFLNLATYNDVPSYINDVREYVVTGRITLTLVILFCAQAISTWIMSISAASSGAKWGSRPSGLWLKLRLRMVSRKMRGVVFTVVILRMFLLLATTIAAILTFTNWFGRRYYWDVTSDLNAALRFGFLYLYLCLAVLLVQMFLGPFLRMRYSAALGALTATWTRDRSERTWVAVSIKLMVGILGTLGLLWGLQISSLIYFSLVDPIALFERYALPYDFHPFPRLPFDAAQILFIALTAAGILLINLLGQAVLPSLFLRITRQRLATPEHQS